LARQLDYIHEHYDRILVLDSSDHEYAGKSNYPNVEYYYYPKWEYIDKLADVVKKVETPYVHLCADDDFYIPESVGMCLDFLESNPAYASTHGQYLSFHWDGRHFDTQPLYVNNIGRDINSDNAEVRLQEAFNPYIQLLYGVHRCENLHDGFCLASEYKVINHRLVELLVTAIAVINGKHKVLPLFFGARETLYNSAGTFVPTIDRVVCKGAQKQYGRFIALIARYLAGKSNISEDRATRIFEDAFRPYLNNKSRRNQQFKQLLPIKLRIFMNHYRFGRNGGIDATANVQSELLDDIENMVRSHDISLYQK